MAKIRIDDSLIRHLAGLLEETGLTEIELGSGREKVRVSRSNVLIRSDETVNSGVLPGSPSDQKSADAGSAAAEEPSADHPGAVKSPMVGTAYLAPEPGAEPFINIGDEVQAGDTMFIIEAMKTMNPVTAPCDGRVERVLVGNAMPVEYGEVLAVID